MAVVVRRFFTFAFAVVVLLFGMPTARADGGRELPRDVPGLPGAEITVPPVPASYQTRDLGWLRIAYAPSAAERVAPILADAEAVKAKITKDLGISVLDHVEVRIAPTFAEMTRLAPSNTVPGYASGVAYPKLHLVLLTMLPPRGADAVELGEVFRHELAHVGLEDATAGHDVPLWFNEGLAIYLSGEDEYSRIGTMARATLGGTLIPLAELDRNMPRELTGVTVAYAESADFMRFLRRDADEARFAAMIERIREGEAFDHAIADAYGSDLRKLEFQWRSEAERRYSSLPLLAGGGFVWVFGIVVLVAAYVKRRGRAKAILARWGREEAMEDAMRARAVGTERPTDDVAGVALPIGAVSVKIEHAGRIHTLH